ncbi:hypothetical protein GGF31_003661 [Allomyces arbusculus]|nr:hypothetical protein GGF31_003661 [Allomyces arbusculus]
MHRPATYDAAGMPPPSYDMGAPQPSPRMPRTAPHLRDQPPAPPVLADQRLATAPSGVVPPPRPPQTRFWQLRLGQYEFGEHTHDLVLLCTNLGGTTPFDESSGTWYMNPVDLARLLCESEELNPALVADRRFQSALRMCPISKTPHLDRAMICEIAAPGEHVTPSEQTRFAATLALAQLTATELAMAADANVRGVHHVRETNVATAMRALRDLQITGAPLPFPVPGMLLIAPHDSSARDTPVPAGPISPSYAGARLAMPPPPPPESPLQSPTALGPSQPPQAIVLSNPAPLYVPPPPASSSSAPPPPAPASSVPPPPPPPAPAAVVSSATPEAKSGPDAGGKRPRASMSQGSGATPTRGGRAHGGRSRGPSLSEGNPRKRPRIEVDENTTAMDGVQAVVAATGVSSSTVRRLSVGHAALTVSSEQQREIQRIREEQQSRIAQQNKRAQAAAGAAGSAVTPATSEPTTPAPAEPVPQEEPADEPMEGSPVSDSPPPPPPPSKRRGRPRKDKAAAVDESPAAPTLALAPALTLATLLTGSTAEDGDTNASTAAPTLSAPRTLSPVLPPPPAPAPTIIPAVLPPPPPLSSIVSSTSGTDSATTPSVIVEPATFGARYPTAPHLSRPDFLNTAAATSDPSLPYSTAGVVIPPLHVADTRQVETAPPPPVRRRISSSRLSAGGSRRHVPPPPPPPPVPSTRDVAMPDAPAAPTDARSTAAPPAAALRTEFLAVMAAVFDSVTTGSRPVTQHLSPALVAALAPVVAAPGTTAPPAPPAPDLAERVTALVDRIAPLEERLRAFETAEAKRVREAETAVVERVGAAETADTERVRAAEIADTERVRAAETTEAERARAAETETAAAERASAADVLVERLTALETRLGAVDGGNADRAAGLVDRVVALETRAQQAAKTTDADHVAAMAQLVERVAALENQVRDADRAADTALVARIGELEDRLQAMREERVTAESALVERFAPLEDRLRAVENGTTEQTMALADRVTAVERQVRDVGRDLGNTEGIVDDLIDQAKRIKPLEIRQRAAEGNTASHAALAGLIAPLEDRLRAIEENTVDCAVLADRITPIEDRLRVMGGDLGDHRALAGRIALLEQQVHGMNEGAADHVAAAVADHLDSLKEALTALQASHTDLERTTKEKTTATAKALKQHEDSLAEQFAALDHRLVVLDNYVAAVMDRTEALENQRAAPEPRVRVLEGATRDGDHAAVNHQGVGARRPAVRYSPGDGEYAAANGQGGDPQSMEVRHH